MARTEKKTAQKVPNFVDDKSSLQKIMNTYIYLRNKISFLF